MTASHVDYALTALCLWREARGQGQAGMTAVACVLRNRVLKNNSTYFAEVTKPLQFTSVTGSKQHGLKEDDPQLGNFPGPSEIWWTTAQLVAGNVIDNAVQDITSGATLYWNPDGIESTANFELPNGSIVKFPQGWNPARVRWTATIGAHIFLKEV